MGARSIRGSAAWRSGSMAARSKVSARSKASATVAGRAGAASAANVVAMTPPAAAVATAPVVAAGKKDLYEIGEIPPLGHVPEEDVRVGHPARSGTVRPTRPCRSTFCPTWELDSHDVLVLVMAAGVNYNGVWAALGTPIMLDAARTPSCRGLRRGRHHLCGRPQGEALEGRRRGRHPLQPRRRRRRGMQRRPSTYPALPAHRGLRDTGRLVRAVLPRAGPPAGWSGPST